MTEDIFNRLGEPFDQSAVHWRAQNFTKDGSKALALAYLDARDVMMRLDDVVGPANWQDSYAETAKGRVIATISLRIDDEWISKSDGAGDTAVEGEKGALSDAFKRAAVKWRVGRYLYDMPPIWVPCEAWRKDDRSKWVFRKWTANPWSLVNNPPEIPTVSEMTGAAQSETPPASADSDRQRAIDTDNINLEAAKDIEDLTARYTAIFRRWNEGHGQASPANVPDAVVATKDAMKAKLAEEQEAA